jgi:crotonobetainyl-CoA:carnitine CoA-transferase CaiB-like acyl-CoA transferase
MHSDPRALEGIRVLDLSRFISGPHCTMLLADMGAEVIKVESTKGELTRSFPPQVGDDSLFYMVLNRNKKGVTLDLWQEEGKATLRELIARSDVLVENFRPGVMAAMGFSYDEVKAINDRIVMVSISGFGQDGPWATRGCFDAIAQAASGMMSLTGWPDGPPTVAGTFVSDYLTAIYAAFGTVVALRHSERTGRGQWLDVSLLDASVSTLITYLSAHLMNGSVTGRAGNDDRFLKPASAYEARDGHVYLSLASESHVASIVRIVEEGDALPPDGAQRALLIAPTTPEARLERAAALACHIAAFVRSRSCSEVVALLEGAGIPVAKVATIDEVATNPQVVHRRLMQAVDHPVAGEVHLPGTPFKLSATPGTIRSAPPTLGQHNDEVYEGLLDYGRDRIESMRRNGVI